MASESGSLKSALTAINNIEIKLDATNNTSVKLGKSNGLIPRNYSCQRANDKIIITTNLNQEPARMSGAGRPLQYLLVPGDAANDEERCISSIGT